MEDLVPGLLASAAILLSFGALFRTLSSIRTQLKFDKYLVDRISSKSAIDPQLNKVVKLLNSAYWDNHKRLSDDIVAEMKVIITDIAESARKDYSDIDPIIIDKIITMNDESFERFSERLAHSVVGSRDRTGRIFDKIESTIENVAH